MNKTFYFLLQLFFASYSLSVAFVDYFLYTKYSRNGNTMEQQKLKKSGGNLIKFSAKRAAAAVSN